MKLACSGESLPEQNMHSYICADSELAGNENVFSALKRGIECILFYDAKAKTNVMNDYGFPKTYLIKGAPGCGKTTAIKSAVKHGREFSARIGKTIFVTNIGNKFKSEYYSKSAQELRKTFNAFFSGSQINIGIIEDIDTVFSRRNDLMNAEDSANLGEALNLLEGVETVNLGNYIVIATTNNSLDTALEQRLGECILEAKGPETLEHYEKILKINLNGTAKFVPDMRKAAYIAMQKKLSGRDVKNICKTLASEIICLDANPEIYSLSMAKQKQFLESGFAKISDERIMGIIEEYEKQKTFKNG